MAKVSNLRCEAVASAATASPIQNHAIKSTQRHKAVVKRQHHKPSESLDRKPKTEGSPRSVEITIVDL